MCIYIGAFVFICFGVHKHVNQWVVYWLMFRWSLWRLLFAYAYHVLLFFPWQFKLFRPRWNLYFRSIVHLHTKALICSRSLSLSPEWKLWANNLLGKNQLQGERQLPSTSALMPWPPLLPSWVPLWLFLLVHLWRTMLSTSPSALLAAEFALKFCHCKNLALRTSLALRARTILQSQGSIKPRIPITTFSPMFALRISYDNLQLLIFSCQGFPASRGHYRGWGKVSMILVVGQFCFPSWGISQHVNPRYGCWRTLKDCSHNMVPLCCSLSRYSAS